MAININSQPSGIVPAGNKSIIKVGGSEYSVGGVIAADYKIVCKIYRITIVGGSPVSTLIATIEGIPLIACTKNLTIPANLPLTSTIYKAVRMPIGVLAIEAIRIR
jgi:hypothetical protein